MVTSLVPPRALRFGLHLLFAGLLAVVAASTPGAVVAVVVMAACYAVGPLTAAIGRFPAPTAWWLAALGAAWLAVLALSPAGVWLAFPMFFLHLHLLPPRWGPAAVVVTTALAIAGFAWHSGELGVAGVIGPVIGAAVTIATVLGYQALHRESEQRRAVVEQLRATRDELATAERRAGVLAERERLAREIHDTLAQGLSSIQLLLRAAERGDADAAVHLARARHTAQDNLAEARRFVHALSPPDLDGGTLTGALRRLCATTAERTGVDVHFHIDGEPMAILLAHEVALLRIAQSALANTARHAHATRADVTLSFMDTGICMDVVDDGSGFDVAEAGFGLRSMRARAEDLGGMLAVESGPGHGTAVAVRFDFR